MQRTPENEETMVAVRAELAGRQDHDQEEGTQLKRKKETRASVAY